MWSNSCVLRSRFLCLMRSLSGVLGSCLTFLTAPLPCFWLLLSLLCAVALLYPGLLLALSHGFCPELFVVSLFVVAPVCWTRACFIVCSPTLCPGLLLASWHGLAVSQKTGKHILQVEAATCSTWSKGAGLKWQGLEERGGIRRPE